MLGTKRAREMNDEWLILVSAIGAVMLGFSIGFLLCRRPAPVSDVEKQQTLEIGSIRDTLYSALGKLHISYQSDSSGGSGGPLHHVKERSPLQKQGELFNWNDHPDFILEAVENGWSRFTFLSPPSSSSTASIPASALHSLCGAEADGRQPEVETGWELPSESLDLVQTVRLNPGLKKRIEDGGESRCCCSRMALPLPGPPVAESSFPQEAYFEITILHLHQLQPPSGRRKRSKVSCVVDYDQRKLIQEILDGSGIDSSRAVEEERLANEGDGNFKDVVISAGFTTGGSSPNKMPGSYPGSVGFNSNGSVHLDGAILLFESDKVNWGAANSVIGCGFDPSKKKVFFTVDSALLLVIHCNSDAFESPLYPSLGANTDVKVSVNLGQSPFVYAPANAHRTPDPCFLRPLAAADDRAVLANYEESRELFSLEIGAQWNDNFHSKSSNGNRNSRITSPNTLSRNI